MEEQVEVVDDEGKVLRIVPRSVMREENLRHKSTVILVFNSKGEVFIHKRSMEKDVFPGVYDIFCGGVVGAGESFDEAAKRELAEELGIGDAEPKFLFKYRYKDDKTSNFFHVYSAIYDGLIEFRDGEIDEGFFMPLEKVEGFMAKNPFAPDTKAVFERYKEFHGV
ncbi:MAG: NUDIX domain-containing protein [Nanoarchaeota archaeon]|nr:NUDIX domain-containing protein [Nanoarchaeota archaeon]